MATILITGGSGLIGKALTQALVAGQHQVIIVSRSQHQSDNKNVSYATWDVNKQFIDPDAIQKADHIIHLAGAGVADERWTEKRKEEIVKSRVDSGRLLVKAVRESGKPLKSFVSASATGWYGADPIIPNLTPFREDQPAAQDFLAQTCVKWEASTHELITMGVRVVYLRTGIVLSNDGGAFKEFKMPLKFGLQTTLGKGDQIVSWIHIDDMVAMYIKSIEDQNIEGVYNAVAPAPVSNEVLMKKLGAKKKPIIRIPIHVPAFVLQTMMGEMSVEVLKSATVDAGKIINSGYRFTYPDIDSAIDQLVKN